MSRKGSAEEMYAAFPSPLFLFGFHILFLMCLKPIIKQTGSDICVFNKHTAYIPVIAFSKMTCFGFADMFYCLLCDCVLGKGFALKPHSRN